jgi:hypothetical protein
VEIKSSKGGLGIPWLGNQQGAAFGHQSKKRSKSHNFLMNFGRVGREKDNCFIIFKFLVECTKI